MKLNFDKMNIKKKFLQPEDEPRNAAYHFKNAKMHPVENTKISES